MAKSEPAKAAVAAGAGAAAGPIVRVCIGLAAYGIYQAVKR